MGIYLSNSILKISKQENDKQEREKEKVKKRKKEWKSQLRTCYVAITLDPRPWEKLVRATLKREQHRNAGQGHARVPSGIAGAVPPSLAQTTNIDLILQAADEVQSEDPNVARICKCSIIA